MKQKRTRLEKREKIQATLEGYRRFDFDYISYGHNWSAPDENFRYRQNAINRFFTLCIRTVLQLVGPPLIKIAYGAKVTGRKNLKDLKGKGAICVCNHISYLDTLFVRQAVGHYRSFHTMAPFNNKNGLGGWFIRHGGLLPLGGNLAAAKNLDAEIERLLKDGKIINIYAEKAMWVNYKKPRPTMSGAFHYAVKYNVPVVPVFCTFETNKRGHMKKLRINVLPPVYADEGLARREKIAKFKTDFEAAWRQCYENSYKKPLEYLPDRRKSTS